MGSSKLTQPINNAVFTGTQSERIANQTVGTTLTATLTVNGFTGGSSPSIRLRIFSVDTNGNRIGTKLNSGTGILTAPGQTVLVYGPDGSNSTMGDDKNNGALPPRFDAEINTNGDQTSTDMRLDIAMS